MTDLSRQAFEQARWLEHGWVGPEHFLLALLAESSVASEALAGLGVTYDEYVERLRGYRGDAVPRYDRAKGLTGPNPAGHQLMGRAEGFAAAAGRDSPAPEHWLLAMVYSDHDNLPALLGGHGATLRALLDELRRRGVQVPDLDPPASRPWRGHHRLDVTEAELQPAIDLLVQKYPPGSAWRWGMNWTSDAEPRHPYLVAEEGIDLDAILAAVRARTGGPQT
jgi:hypothetical protein